MKSIPKNRLTTREPKRGEGGTAVKKLALLLVLMVIPGILAAAGESTMGTIELRSEAEVEISVTQDDGSQTTQRLPATKVIPGDEVIFTLHYRNYGTEPAEDVFITNPVPQHMELQGPAQLPAGLEITYSVDGGRSFGSMAQLKTTDSAGGERPAVPSDCTHIRWTFHKPLEPGATGSVAYTALLL
jgi:uncharacterized repeat protein (TIGR01451 family)